MHAGGLLQDGQPAVAAGALETVAVMHSVWNPLDRQECSSCGYCRACDTIAELLHCGAFAHAGGPALEQVMQNATEMTILITMTLSRPPKQTLVT